MKEKIVLKSVNPQEYPDLEVECKIIENDKIGEYLKHIPEEKKFYAYKNGAVQARVGVPGEEVKTTLKTEVNGKEYILSEETNTVQQRENGVDIVVTNTSSTSNEEYVVKSDKFVKTYTANADGTEYIPVYDSRLLTQVDEDVIIMTAWGSKAVCLAGGYIVTYSAEDNDYNTLEKGAFNSTYVKEKQQVKDYKK